MKHGPARATLKLLSGLALVPGWLTHAQGSPAARARERRFLEGAARAFVRDIHLTGAAPAGPGTLYIANHMSWLDIPVLASRLDARFIAKSEVARWPVIGPLARRAGTMFVERDRRQGAAGQADAIARRLRGGESLILFPEGTTSDGTGVLPFRSSLFAAARFARSVQPVAICYRGADGRALEGRALADFVWIDEEPLLPNVGRVARASLSAEIFVQPALARHQDESRKTLAERCRAQIVDGYAGMRRVAPSATAGLHAPVRPDPETA